MLSLFPALVIEEAYQGYPSRMQGKYQSPAACQALYSHDDWAIDAPIAALRNLSKKLTAGPCLTGNSVTDKGQYR